MQDPAPILLLQINDGAIACHPKPPGPWTQRAREIVVVFQLDQDGEDGDDEVERDEAEIEERWTGEERFGEGAEPGAHLGRSRARRPARPFRGGGEAVDGGGATRAF